MQNNIYFSIIVPVFNSEKYISSCIKSILGQSYKYFELLLIDDGSTDKSLKICKQYEKKDNRIITIHTENHGSSYARNIGIDNSKYNYILFVDSDDLLETNSLNVFYEMICNYSDFDLIQTKITEFYKNIPSIDNNYNDSYELSSNDLDSARCILLSGIARRDNIIMPGPVCKIYRKDILNENHIRFNENFYIYEDGIFNIEYLFHCHKVYVCNSITYFYRKSNSSSITYSYKEDYLQQRYIMMDYMSKIIKSSKYEDMLFNNFCIESLFSIYFYYLFNPKRPANPKLQKKEFYDIISYPNINNSIHSLGIKKLTIKKKIIILLTILKQFNIIKIIYKIEFKRRKDYV